MLERLLLRLVVQHKAETRALGLTFKADRFKCASMRHVHCFMLISVLALRFVSLFNKRILYCIV